MAVAGVETLQPVLTLLSAGVAAAFLSRSVNASPIVGYLAIGVLIGPFGLNLIQPTEMTSLLAELGVVFLLFDIGLHFSLQELRQSRNDMLKLAPLQMGLTGLGFVLVLLAFNLDWPYAVILGLSLGLSSTAVVSRVLSDRNLRSCPLGHSATAVLIFQDIIAIFLLIFAASLGDETANLGVLLAIAIGKSLLAFAAAVLAGRFLVRPLFRLLAATRNQEAFTGVALLLVLASAWATARAELSLTLGAFLAGLAISDTRYRHQVMMEVQPFRGLLLSLFFINVGLMVDVPRLGQSIFLVLGATVLLIVGKTVLGYLAARLAGWSMPGATQLAFLIGQGSEFTLVIASITSIVAGVDPVVRDVIVASVALSLATAPVWTGLGLRLAREVARRRKGQTATVDSNKQTRPVLITGLTPPVRLAIDGLRSFNIPYKALDSDPERFVEALADGYEVSFGDAANLQLVDLIGASSARAVVIGNPRYEVSKAVTPAVKQRFGDIQRFVALSDPVDVDRFRALGMRAHLTTGEPAGIELAADLLRVLGVEEAKLVEWIASQRDLVQEANRDTDRPVAA